MTTPKPEQMETSLDVLTKKLTEQIEKRAEAKQRAEYAMQLRQRRCNIVPMRKTASQPFRSELGIERTPIFVSSAYRQDWREYQRQIVDPESQETIVQIVRVGRKHENDRPRGVLTQIHQHVFYKLLALWDRAEYPLAVLQNGEHQIAMGTFRQSAYSLVRFIDGDVSGYRYKRLRSVLGDLSAIPIVREHHYLHRGTVDVDDFTLLAAAEWTGRELDPERGTPRPTGRSEVRIVFSPTVTEGFLRAEYKPLLLTPYLSVRSGSGRRAELAALLYPFLDYELSRKPHYHAKLSQLGERFGCSPQEYASQRKRQFLSAVKALDGLPILAETFRLRVRLIRSQDGSDWVLEARREGQESLPL